MSRQIIIKTADQLGAGSISLTLSPISTSWELVSVELITNIAPTTAGNLEVYRKNTVLGSDYDGLRYAADPTGGTTSTIESNARFGENDTIVVQYANPDARNCRLVVELDANPAE
jgi:hypothetical protein